MWGKKEKEEIESTIIIRVCVGCVLPENSKMIGSGTYILLSNGQKVDEPFYDYEIPEKYMESFIEQNYEQLLKYKLIDEPKKEETLEDKNVVKETTTRGYAQDYKKKKYK